jgi:hypothetical protein
LRANHNSVSDILENAYRQRNKKMIRGTIAVLVVAVFYGVPSLYFFLYILVGLWGGYLKVSYVEVFLKPWVLYFGPLT